MMVSRVSVSPFVEFTKQETKVPITRRFQQQVEKYPRNIALKNGETRISYRELDQLVNGIAITIVETEENGEQPIALLFSSKEKMIAGIFGVLKTGRPWVPLDISHPFSRNSYLVSDSRASIILTDNEGLPIAREFSPCSYINVDEIVPSNKDLDLPLSRTNISHIIYTSGSSGNPKGVVHTHRNVLEFVRAYTNSFRISNYDRHTLLASLSHSGGITSAFRILLNGATLLPYDLREKGLMDLADWLREEQISIYHSVPIVFREFLKNNIKPFPSVRLIQLGGEPVSIKDVELYRKHFSGDCVLALILGTTEVGTHSQYFVNRTTTFPKRIVPAGYPFGEKKVLLLGEDKKPVPFGETGEIAIKSRYLALGYWNKKEITEKSFCNANDGEKIYYTGDLGRFIDDNCLVYLGRKDLQVKIRGYRIELLEIELELLGHNAIDSCAVTAEENSQQDKIIVAFVVPKTISPSHEELRQYLRDKLPDYMIPSAFLSLKFLPLNAQRKIDRQALHRIFTSYHHEPEFVAPRSNEEKLVVKLWREQFPREKIGINSDFFLLGGDSINAFHIIAGLHEQRSVRITIQDIFDNPTVAELSECIQRMKEQSSKI